MIISNQELENLFLYENSSKVIHVATHTCCYDITLSFTLLEETTNFVGGIESINFHLQIYLLHNDISDRDIIKGNISYLIDSNSCYITKTLNIVIQPVIPMNPDLYKEILPPIIESKNDMKYVKRNQAKTLRFDAF